MASWNRYAASTKMIPASARSIVYQRGPKTVPVFINGKAITGLTMRIIPRSSGGWDLMDSSEVNKLSEIIDLPRNYSLDISEISPSGVHLGRTHIVFNNSNRSTNRVMPNNFTSNNRGKSISGGKSRRRNRNRRTRRA